MSSTTDVKPMKLFYFDIAGNGEPIRLIAAQGKLLDKFEDVRVSGPTEWPELKTSGKLAFEQLPALQVGDESEMLVQTSAIIRYIGKVSGMYPEGAY
jgi:glutathione S-transferase